MIYERKLPISSDMGTRGPLPKTAFSEIKAPCRGVGEPPTYISDNAKRHYMQLAAMLADRLEPEDEVLLATCSQAMAEIAEANVTLARNGYVNEGPQGEVASPWVNIRDKAHKRFDVACGKLGLSPADRHRIKASLASNDPQAGSPEFNDGESA